MNIIKHIPSFFRILGKNYTVILCPKSAMPTEFGLCDSENQRIHLMMETSNATMLDTILHECLHGIDFNMHLELSERQVHALATGLVALFLDNPKLVSLLKEASCGRVGESGTRKGTR